MSRRTIRVGTRGSMLSVWQASWVADRLAVLLPETDVEIVTVRTRGDAHVGPFTDSGVKGLFTSELEAAVVDGRVDVAVHSLKDLPVTTKGGLAIAAVPLRDDPRDALVSRSGAGIGALPDGAKIGTSSPRRACLIRSRRPDVKIVPLRGNVDTRVRQLDEGRCDGIVLAAAGLVRLDLDERISERLDPGDFPPAPGQGALAVQARSEDAELYGAVSAMDDSAARATSSAERFCLEVLGGGCARPVGAYASLGPSGLDLVAFVGALDGTKILRARASGADPRDVGRAAADGLLRQGADELLS